MRRLLVSLVATLMCVAVLPVQAQMRGRGGVGFARPGVGFGRSVVVRPGFSRFRGGFVGGFRFGHGPRVIIGSRAFFHPRIFPQVYFAASPFYYGGYGYGYPVVVAPQYPMAPSGYDASDIQLAEEVGRLKAEVEHLRDERRMREQHEYDEEQRQQQPQPQPMRAVPSAPTPPTTFVYRNGRREDVRSYAIIGQTLWILSEARARKVPLAEIDLDATAKTNDANGVPFYVPGSRPQPAVQPESVEPVQPKTVEPKKSATGLIARR